MTDQAKQMLARMVQANLPVPTPSNPGLAELWELGYVTRGPVPPSMPYPDDYELWTLTQKGKEAHV